MNSELFPRGLLRPELFIGVASSIAARGIGVNLSVAGHPSGSHFSGKRYGRGEVGEYVLIEGQQNLILGRVSEIHLPEYERRTITPEYTSKNNLDAIGHIQLLGSVRMDSFHVSAGVEAYPRLGDRIYSAPHEFIAKLPLLMERNATASPKVLLNLGAVDPSNESIISIRPERLFGRHCAILGATGGGKSWTTARVIEECRRFNSKIILIDATGEYRDFSGEDVAHCHLGSPVKKSEVSIQCALPPTSFLESDFVALFEPAGKVQGPKLRAAIRSLRLAHLKPHLAPEGFIKKINAQKKSIHDAEKDPTVARLLDDPKQAFDPKQLTAQLEQECVYPDGFGSGRGEKDLTKWGGEDGNFSHCLSLVARINAVLTSPAFHCVFQQDGKKLTEEIDSFFSGNKKLLRVCVSGIAYEFHAREIIVNVLGRYLLTKARSGDFLARPTVVIVDEAHNFLGHHLGSEDYSSRLDSFELIAKEGRKFGLNVCLATQRPRDITEGVLSQMGTLIVHRLTNDRDREIVERACGEIDRAASAFLPNLRPGEAAVIGADFPIPLTIQMHKPETKPQSEGPDYQGKW